MDRPDEKACGDCSLCCHVYGISELRKPKGVWCGHHRAGQGCAIHPDRPESCRAFDCLWLQDATLGPEWKPSRSRMVLSLTPWAGTLALRITVHPGWPNAWTRQPFRADIERWAREFPPQQRIVMVHAAGGTVLVLPGREVRFSDATLDEAAGVRVTSGPQGWDVTLVPRAAAEAA